MGVSLGINWINMAKFYLNGGQEYEINSIAELAECLGEQIRGFDYLEVFENKVLVYHRNDPSGIQIGRVIGLSDAIIPIK